MFILYMYTVVVMTGASPSYYETRKDWRPSGEFTSKVNCDNAIKELKLSPDLAKCLPK